MTSATTPSTVGMAKPRLAPDLIREGAVKAGVCPRPMVKRRTDTLTGETVYIPIPCGSTLASVCPPCAEYKRRLRMKDLSEGWHLEVEPEPRAREEEPAESEDEDADELEEETPSRRVRSTRRPSDLPDLPRVKMTTRTIGRTFTAKDGKTWRPSMFVTLTLPSYGRVNDDGTPVHPGGYDYRRAALDALHLPKLFERFVQNLRRVVGYEVQYFGTLEPQRRLAPHLHIAIRGAISRKLLKQVISATYASVWWPPHEEAVYRGDNLPVWDHAHSAYTDPQTGRALPTWDQALDALDSGSEAAPAHLVRFGDQTDIQGLIADSNQTTRRVRYMTKYLTKNLSDPISDHDDTSDGENQGRRRAHVERLHQEVRWLPCSPRCANWLRYGIQPKNAKDGMRPGYCKSKAHDDQHLGCGGRRVLKSGKWTGKTLEEHKADRAAYLRSVLEAAGIAMDDHTEYSATITTDDGDVRWVWENLDPDETGLDYARVINLALAKRNAWREQYEQARERLGPDHPELFSNPATTTESEAA